MRIRPVKTKQELRQVYDMSVEYGENILPNIKNFLICFWVRGKEIN